MIKYDGKLWLSTGKHRKDMSWQSKPWQWSELVERLQESYQTAETLKNYQNFKKDRQVEIKDVGGFVGGVVTGGRRLKGKVGSRFLVTLDIDYAPPGFWGYFPLIYDNAAFLYATHAHTPEKPRLRLVMPLAREVLADQYEAIARTIAGDLGIDYFDDTTYEPERLMFWPSTPKDVDYYWEFQDGPFLDPDLILGRYYNWRDSSQWPLSSRAREIPKRLKKQQGDPHEKPGLIGAFCRTYTIQEAIEEYLSDAYEATDDENRYTFMQGSTAKGLVIYEDKYAYSHHGTDPISGRLCNAFDLVRLHLYGAQDDDRLEKDPDTPVNELPSYKAMTEKASKSKAVAAELAMARFEEIDRVFENEEEVDKDFLKELDREKKSGNLLSTIKNAYLILKHDPALKEAFAYDEFAHREIVLRDLPWRKPKKLGKPMGNKDEAGIRGFIERNYGGIAKEKIFDGMDLLMMEKSFHPVKDYLESLTWDGVDRIDTLLKVYFGIKLDRYSRMIISKAIIGGVARIYDPGCKYENMLVLTGEEGKGKSTFFRKLGGEWFTDTFGPLDNLKTASENLQGKWLIEIGELAAFNKQEHSTIKSFTSAQMDWFRAAYARRNEEHPRQCFFVGTINKKKFLNDPTSEDRRFWPIEIDAARRELDPKVDLTPEEVSQIWAEAVQRYKNNEVHWLSEDEEAFVKSQKNEYRETDPRDEVISDYLEMPVPDEYYRLNEFEKRLYIGNKDNWSGEPIHKVTISEIWQTLFNGKVKDQTKYNTQFIRDYFEKRKEWKAGVFRIRTILVRGYVKSGKTAVTKFDGLL